MAKSARLYLFGILALGCFASSAFGDSQDISLLGGDTTVDDISSNAFDHPIANLSNSKALQEHDLGEQGFRRNFAKTLVRGGIRIGPKFNNVSCVGCHINNGRGEPSFGRGTSQTVIKVSRGTGTPLVPGGPVPLPRIGTQLRDHSTTGTKADARLHLTWELIAGSYADGTSYELRKPKLSINPNLSPSILISMRRPPPVLGIGLLDAVDPTTLESLADPNDFNSDGISGRVNIVWDRVRRRSVIGKFGWKASAPSAAQQIATAYAIDMGITNPLLRLTDKIPDIDRKILNRTIFYTLTLAIPRARTHDSVLAQDGASLFHSMGCNSCHVTTLVTGNHSIRELSNQVIHPFTDLLLHDMGPGLADNRPEFAASGSEFRTPPLWGIGLTKAVLGNKEESYLHDGRARTFEEAILWHGGEAEWAKEFFRNLSAQDRDKLIQFLKSI